MKLKTDNNGQDFGFKKFAFRIDEKHQMKAIWALINLYEHKIRTPVQEIISNARDAHREVGKPDHTFKVKVTDDKFIVRDFGSGIDPEKAQNIFCSIGESTKTNDNTQTGGFGIGAKSPLAYAKQFEVYSYVNGIEYHYVIAKNGEMLDMNLVSHNTTEKPNGTKVIVPIKNNKGDYWRKSDHEQFVEAVRRTCMFWDKKPEFNHDHDEMDVLKVKGLDNCGYYNCKGYTNNFVVVDGIPYNVGNRTSSNHKVLFFNTGDIRLHETRERLADNDADMEFNYAKITPKVDELSKYFRDDRINNYVNKNDLLNSFATLSKYGINFLYRHGDFIFTGSSFYRDDRNSLNVYASRSGSRYPYKYKYYKDDYTSLNYNNTEVYYNDENESQAKVSRRVKNYVESFVDNKKEVQVWVTDDKNFAKSIGAKKVSSLEMPKVNRSGVKKTTGEITVTKITRGGWQSRYNFKLENITHQWLYLSFKDDVNMALLRFAYAKGYQVCKLSKDSIDAVQNHVKFTSFQKWVDSYEITKEEKLAIYDRAADTSTMYVNFTESIDPKVKEFGERLNRYKYPNDEATIPSQLYTLEIKSELEKINSNNSQIDSLRTYIRKEYPYLQGNKEANTEYINALYHYRKNLHGIK